MVLGATGLLALCASCSTFDTGIGDLPSGSGWRRLPTHKWLLNDGFGKANIIYCPPASCAHPAVVATFEAQGEMATRLLRALANPKSLLAAKRFEVATARDPRFKRKPEKTPRKSSEQAEPVEADGIAGYRVTLSPKEADGHAAYAVVLAKREGDTVKAALAVTVDPQAALQQARAAAKTF
ncbi:hypothetical protein SAMN05444161_0122 [Rhizobiales bacterium GAS191]|nr:hypothetical protein SAMN05444161_0122 [Rhizobiales bacterium GAS191]SED26971.1 hypothetical protein SAMN05519104_3185 [Rhizobiales bacterium GAS188]